MQSVAPRSSLEARLLLRAGLALYLLALLACAWEVLALQPPDSPLHLGVLAGPIAQLGSLSFALGTGSLLIGLLWPSLYAAGEGRVVAASLLLGATLHVGALFYAASRGLLAVQLLDQRLDARLALYCRAFALTLTGAGLLALSIRALRR